MAAPPCPLLGSGITDDTLLRIARFLPTARDLVSHQLTYPCASQVAWSVPLPVGAV